MRSKRVDGAHGPVRVWVGGSGPALLLVHGAWGDARAHWSAVWDALARRHTVVAPDLPGWGETDRWPRASCSELALTLSAALDGEGMRSAAVVGSSFGAAVAWQWAAEHPDRAQQAVLVNGTALPGLPAWFRSVCGLWPMREAVVAISRAATFQRRTILNALVRPEAFGPGFVDAAVAGGARAAEIGFDAVRYQPSGGTPACPLALVWGDRDTLISVAQARRLARRLGVPLRTIPGAGHLPQVQAPAEFLAALESALEAGRTVEGAEAMARADSERPAAQHLEDGANDDQHESAHGLP